MKFELMRIQVSANAYVQKAIQLNVLPTIFNYRVIDGSEEIINSNLTGPCERLCAQHFSSAG